MINATDKSLFNYSGGFKVPAWNNRGSMQLIHQRFNWVSARFAGDYRGLLWFPCKIAAVHSSADHLH